MAAYRGVPAGFCSERITSIFQECPHFRSLYLRLCAMKTPFKALFVDHSSVRRVRSEKTNNEFKKSVSNRIPDWSREIRLKRIEALNTLLANGGHVIAAKDSSKVVGMVSLKNEYYAKNRMQLFSFHACPK